MRDGAKLMRRFRLPLAGLLLAAGLGFWALLPQPLFGEPLSAILLARDGTLLGARIAADGQWRFPELSETPEKFALAVVAYEDKRFHSHPGIDPLAVARALRLNWQAGKVVSGASTLTMQLARLIRRRGGDSPPRSYSEKLHESLLALRLEAAYSKRELLAFYASHAPFGGNVVGLEAAAWRYFGRSPAQLSWAEAATLAVLPNAPALVTPGRNRAQLRAKRDALLHRLRQSGTLTALDLQAALAEPLVAEPKPLPDIAPHLLETLRSRYPERHRFLSTLDAALQQAAVRAVTAHGALLQSRGIGNVAALIVDQQGEDGGSLDVLAYVGNADWAVDSKRALAVDIVQRPRSTGSILKPMLYAAMLDSGQLLPKMLLTDVPTQFKGFAPENFDKQYRGAVPADVALAMSLNVPAVRMLRDYGIERFHDLLGRLGMSTLTRPPGDYGLTLVLGGAEGTLWDITRMHADLAALARRDSPQPVPPTLPLRVLRDEPTAKPSPNPLSPAAAWLTTQALLNVIRPPEEGDWREFASSRGIAWKTGTSWGARDAWAVGSSSRYTVGVWAGNADGVGVPELSGGSAAAPLMFVLHDLLPITGPFPQPFASMKTVQVCSDDGYLAGNGCAIDEQWIPLNSHFDRLTPFHRLLHLDADGRRVDSDCERPGNMRHVAWFVLPPTQAYFYRRHHAGYREPPAYRRDCHPRRTGREGPAAMDFVYPNESGRIYVPIDLDGHKGRVVFEAVHRHADAVLYWHIDDDYMGSTETFHQLTLDLSPGEHRVTIVDADGGRLTRNFEVLDPNR